VSEPVLRPAVAWACSCCCLLVLTAHRLTTPRWDLGSGARLEWLINTSDHLIIHVIDRHSNQTRALLWQSTRAADRHSLAASLQLIDTGGYSCTQCDCWGDWRVDLLRNGELVQRLRVYSDGSVSADTRRCKLQLRRPAHWRAWCHKRGIVPDQR